MKSIYYITAVIAIASVCCCTDETDDSFINVSVSEMQETTSSENHFVHLSDVQTLTKTQQRSTRAVDQQANIVCYTDAEQDTLLYICDKGDGGWTIYSSDTRVPAIVAESSEGNFAKASENEALMAWIETMAQDMKAIRNAPDIDLNFTMQEIESNKNFWKSVSMPDAFAKELVIQDSLVTRGAPGPIDLIPDYFLYGHYEFCSVEHYTQVYDSIARLTHTDWDQHSPCNNYCPYKSYSTTQHAPAGCVAIAGAQLLYFLHYKLGVPETAPSDAYCNSNVTAYPNYDWAQYNFTSTIWDNMNSIGVNSDPFVADVGRLARVHYGNNGSGAYDSDLANYAFPAYGISCTYTNYSESYLSSSLLSEMPVYLSASNQDMEGHAFIADRYLRKRNVTKTTYMWVYDSIPHDANGHELQVPILPNKITYSYSSPHISMIGMNWGWGQNYNDPNEWFALSGSWLKNDNNFDYSRKMIYNFSIAD